MLKRVKILRIAVLASAVFAVILLVASLALAALSSISTALVLAVVALGVGEFALLALLILQQGSLQRISTNLGALREAESRHAYHLQEASNASAYYSRQAADSLLTAQMPRRLESELPHVLFVTSNGAGLGHITRCIAIADAGSQQFSSVILTLSTAANRVRSSHPLYYFPSRRADQEWRHWNLAFQRELLRVMSEQHFDAVVFDGPTLFPAVSGAAVSKGAALIWILRGLWRKGKDTSEARLAAELCDAVITPSEGDLLPASEVVPPGIHAQVVDPILNLPPGGFLSRADARSQLSLDPQERAVLVNLGAISQRGWEDAEEQIVRAVQEDTPGSRVYILRSPLDQSPLPNHPDVTRLDLYPIAHLLHAFDLVVSAAGYNSVHELIAAGVPAVLIPNPASVTDDQERRALLASRNTTIAAATTIGQMSAALKTVRTQWASLADQTSDSINPALSTAIQSVEIIVNAIAKQQQYVPAARE